MGFRADVLWNCGRPEEVDVWKEKMLGEREVKRGLREWVEGEVEVEVCGVLS